jgi:NADH-quinone oxidoreductase subunit M
MGFVLLGLMTLSATGLNGAVLQMFSHGIIAGLLFAVVGRMVYDRVHTRVLGELEGMRLGQALPFAAVTFVVASLASMGLPGFSGFVAELQVLIGAWQAFPGLALLTGLGMVVGVVYTVKVMQQVFFGEPPLEPAPDPAIPAPAHALPPITVPERLGAVLLMGTTLAVGLSPGWLIELIDASWSSGLFDALMGGGGG